MKLRNLLITLLFSAGLLAGEASAVAVGETASFTINGARVTGTVRSVAADGTLSVVNGDAVFTLAPQGNIMVTTGSGSAATSGSYTATLNGAAANMVGLGGSLATGAAIGGVSVATIATAVVVIGAAAAAGSSGGSSGTH